MHRGIEITPGTLGKTERWSVGWVARVSTSTKQGESQGAFVVKRINLEIDEMLPRYFLYQRLCFHEARHDSSLFGLGCPSRHVHHTLFSQLPRVSTMASTSQTQEGPDGVPSTFDADIQVLSHAKDTSGIPPVQDAFASTSALLTTIKVRSLPFRRCELQTHVYSGPDLQQTVLR